MSKRECSAVLLAALALCAAGCGGQAGFAGSTYKDPNPLPPDTMVTRAAEVGTHGGRFVLGQTISPKTFNAVMANETSSNDVTQLLFTTLVSFDNGTQQFTPMLAKSWDVSPDGLTWTFDLRRGARFSDGHPITSADVLFSFEVYYDEELHPALQELLKIDGKKFEISAPDSYTVVIRLPNQYAMVLGSVGSARIMPKHVLESSYRSGDYASAYNTSTRPESLVSSGAFMLKQFVPNEKTVLTRNPYWFGVDAKGQRLPYLDELVFLIVPDQNAASLKFQSGELDGLDNVKPEDYKAYADNQEKGDYTLHDLGPTLNTNFLWFNLNKVRKPKPGKRVGQPYVPAAKYAWFSNPDFRRAVSLAIDREAMIGSVFFGDAVKNWSTTTPANKIWNTPEVGGDDYNPEEAKKLLAGLGWKDRDGDGILEDTKGNTVSFTLKTNGDNNTRMQMSNFIKDDLAKVGIRAVPSGVVFNTLIVNLREDFQYEAMLLGFQSGVPPDPGMSQNIYKSSGLTHNWNVEQPRPETAAEAEIDQLIAANVKTLDMAERKRTWKRINEIMNRENFLIWLPIPKIKVPIRNRFGNLEPSVIPHRILWNIERVYMKRPGARA
jgi:peptide/nickel transport system substrate-binding protein